ncbi:hypothetical protein [Kaistella polysaccharea]|uniref:hypothetical protein n=1 Tax=Kaistella polysaccharea TaxID=2878534 RepID=UPI001CF1A0F7|nr:hypothetical protein [Kaistella polysaccharea]
MDVYITTLDRKSEKTVKMILNLFSQDEGELKFKPLKLNQNSLYNKEYHDITEFHYDQIGSICSMIKSEHKIFEEYIVLITDKILDIPSTPSLHQKDWNSAYILKNIIVKSTGYEKLTENRPYLGIAHQVIENIFQSLIKMVINSPQLYKSVHIDSIGCINDYCKDFKDIKTKIMSGRICKKCQERTVQENVSPVVVKQIKNILQRINNVFNDNFEFQNAKIKIESHGKLFIGDTKVDFGRSTVSKLVYMFYLINYNKIITKDDLLNNESVRSKFIQLGLLFDEEYKKENNGAVDYSRLHKLIGKLSTPVRRIKDELELYTFNDSLRQTLLIQSKKTSEYGHYYQIQIPDEQEIEIHNSLWKYQIS